MLESLQIELLFQTFGGMGDSVIDALSAFRMTENAQHFVFLFLMIERGVWMKSVEQYAVAHPSIETTKGVILEALVIQGPLLGKLRKAIVNGYVDVVTMRDITGAGVAVLVDEIVI